MDTPVVRGPEILPDFSLYPWLNNQASGFRSVRVNMPNDTQLKPQHHDKADGYNPSWKWVPPPGIGDAPQHVYNAFSLIPFSVDGPGDRPASFLKIGSQPIVQNFAMRYQGMAVEGGAFLMTGLYTPSPMTSPANSVF